MLPTRIELPITILSVDRSHFPDWVEFSLADADGIAHYFYDKEPVVGCGVDGPFPRVSSLAGELLDKWIDDQGRILGKVTTAKPWFIESKSGETVFVVELPRAREQTI